MRVLRLYIECFASNYKINIYLTVCSWGVAVSFLLTSRSKGLGFLAFLPLDKPMTQIKVRFAPSPTGLLHIGNIRAALYNWLYARKNGGSFMLRIDDTDQVRSKAEYEDAIRQDLTWLGLTWDHTERQSSRMDTYFDLADKLKALGRVYPCFETKDELELKRKVLSNQKLPPVYDRAALNLTPEQIIAYEAEGRKPHWRFKLDWDAPIIWDDAIQGRKEFSAKTMSDPVIIREDGMPLFTFCGMIDDLLDETTYLIRGEDHVSNTAVQIQIGQAAAPLLGKEMKASFAHFPLLVSASGEEMSKRLGTMSIRQMRDEMHLEALAITTMIARLGTSLPMEPVADLEELADNFALESISRNPPKVDMEELRRLNGKILHQTPFAAVEFRLHQLGLHEASEPFWNAVRGELQVLSDAKDWWDVTVGQIEHIIEDVAFSETAASLLPPEPWDQTTWGAWTALVKEKTGKSGKNLFMPLRLALTGKTHGPELRDLLPLIGHRRAEARLLGREL